MKLEFVEALTLAHPFIKGFDQTLYCIDQAEVRAVAQGEISDVVKKRKKEDIEGKEGSSPVFSTTFYIGLAIEPKPGMFPRDSTLSLYQHTPQLQQRAPPAPGNLISRIRPRSSQSW